MNFDVDPDEVLSIVKKYNKEKVDDEEEINDFQEYKLMLKKLNVIKLMQKKELENKTKDCE